MPILRLVLIYLFLAVAVVAVFNREKLGQLVFGETPSETVASAPAAPVASNGTPAPQPAPAPAAPQAPTAMAPVPQAAPAPTAPQYPPISEDDLASPTAPAPRPAPGMLQTPVAPQAPVAAAPTTAQPQSPRPAMPQPAAPTVMDAGVASALNAARTSYWRGDVAGATDQLNALLAANPDNPDLHGELGNLRFSQRDWDAAAEAYLRAAELLVAQGRSAQAAQLLPVLSQIAPDKAQALATRLQTR